MNQAFLENTDTKSAEVSLPGYSWRHIVTFEETNVVGNVYYVRHIAWQGSCREMFLRDHAPSVLNDLSAHLRLVTLKCSCEYFSELHAFDEIEITMRLRRLVQNRISLKFEYYHINSETPVLFARGAQDLGCMQVKGSGLVPVEPPEALAQALVPFGSVTQS